MKNKLILVEGIPGSGKTSTAHALEEIIDAPIEKFIEGDLHPADFAWCACLQENEYNDLLSNYPELEGDIKRFSKPLNDEIVLAYTQIRTERREFYEFCSKREIYQGVISKEAFKSKHLDLWKQFKSKGKVYIFESFFQTQIVELFGMHSCEMDEILLYFNKLLDLVREMNPLIIYLQQENVEETIDRVAKERVYEKHTDWIQLVEEYIGSLTYGKKSKLKGYERSIQFFKDRKALELDVFKNIHAEVVMIDNSDYDFNKVIQKIKDYLKEER